jgi:hypothetical protein
LRQNSLRNGTGNFGLEAGHSVSDEYFDQTGRWLCGIVVPIFGWPYPMLKASNSTAASPNTSTANATGSRSSQIRMIMLPARNHGLTDSMTDRQKGSSILFSCYPGGAFRQHSAANGRMILEL